MGKAVRRKTRVKAPRSKKQGFLQKRLAFIFGSLFAALFVAFILVSKTPTAPVCANALSCIKDLGGNFEKDGYTGEFMGKNITIAPEVIARSERPQTVLGDTTARKIIYIDLATQHLYAKEGDRTVYDFLVSTGKWGRTPTGTFSIWIKLRYTRMEGGNKAIGTYYNLPNVPYTMFFYNDQVSKSTGYGIHGAYWHNNFGHPMSHGCINMRTEDVAKLYYWANPQLGTESGYATADNPGTQIVIYGEAPQE